MSDNYFESLKPGDSIRISANSYCLGEFARARVDRLTATQIVVGDVRFRRSDGRKAGGANTGMARIVEPSWKYVRREVRDRTESRFRRGVLAIQAVDSGSVSLRQMRTLERLVQDITGEDLNVS